MGYSTKGSGTQKYVGTGSFFFPTGSGDTYDLTDVKAEFTPNKSKASPYMDPDVEYLRELDPASAANLARYAYVNEALLVDIFELDDVSDLTPAQKALVGWWKLGAGSLWDIIPEGGDFTGLKLAKGEKMISPKTAFLGQFAGANGCDVKFTYAGQVIAGTSDIRSGTSKYVMFQNYVPRTIKLTDISVDFIPNKSKASPYMDPDVEYLRELDPASAANLARYAYVNAALLVDIYELDDESELTPAQLENVGWWKLGAESLWDIIPEGGDFSAYRNGAKIDLEPGKAFLGQFAGANGCDVHLNFPAAY